MTSEWQRVVLGDVAELKYGFAFKSGQFQEAGVDRLARGANIGQGRLDWSNTKYWPSDSMDGVGDYRLQEGDVLLAMDRPWIEAGLKYARVESSDLPSLLVQRVARLRARTEIADQRFLYYAIGSPEFTNYILSVQTGTTVPHISGKQISAHKVWLPTLPEQRAIGEVLGAIDDCIEHARASVALFRSSLRLSYLGLPTRTYPVSPAGDILELSGGGTPSTSNPEFWGGPHRWLTPRDLSRASSPAVIDSERTLTDEGLSAISSGLHPKGTVLLSSRAPIGYIAFAAVPLAINQGFIAFKPSAAAVPGYIMCWLEQSLDAIKARAGGSTFAEISKRAFRPIPFPVPSGPEYTRFAELAAGLLDGISEAENAVRCLQGLRDTLLPELLSGRLRIEDPEQLLEGAM